MPSLAGLFGRKNKASSKQRANGNETDSALSSPTTDYVTPDRSMPSSPNGRSTLRPDAARGDPTPSSVYPSVAASSGKIRLPFSRKKASAAASTTSVVTTFSASQDSHFGTPPRPAYFTPRNSTSAASDTDVDGRRLRPPPSKSAIFAAYGDPHSALSTRSLPSEHSPLTITTSNTPPPIPPPVPPKKPGFFHWSKSTPASPQTTFGKVKAKTSASPPQLSPTSPISDPNSSFNLKSFRHVVPPATGPSPNASNTSLSHTVPRQRGESVASESSQRISVAAFREAQARRSAAGSPVPSNRAPSPGPLSAHTYGTRPQQQQHIRKRRLSGLAYTSDSDESEDDDDEEENSDSSRSPPRGGAVIVRRKRTVTKRPEEPSTMKGRATKSEVGHGSSTHNAAKRDYTPAPRSQSSHVVLSQYSDRSSRQNDEELDTREDTRSRSSLGFDTGTRSWASASTSAPASSAAARRASIVAAANAIPLPNANGKHHTGASSAHSTPAPTAATTPSSSKHARQPAGLSHSSHTASTSNHDADSDSDSDSDDAPLATLLPPRRPGSALSASSNSSLRSGRPAPKPLIDISTLTNARPVPISKSKSMDVEAFTAGATLLGQVMSTSPPSSSPVVTSVSPPTRFVSPPASPTREVKEFFPSSGAGAGAGSGQQLRSSAGAPMRRETSPGGGEEGRGPGQKRERDGLGERLTRVVQLKAGSGSGSGSNSSVGSGSVGTGSGAGGSDSKSLTTMQPVSAPTLPKTKSLPMTKTTPMERNSNPPEEVEDLAAVLGAGIHLIRRTDSPSEESASSKSDSESESESEEGGDGDGGMYAKGKPSQSQQREQKAPNRNEKREEKESGLIAPIPIKQRAPPPAFSVTSRPPLNRGGGGGGDRTSVASTTLQGSAQGVRQRSSTLIPSSSSSSAAANATAAVNATATKSDGRPGILNGSKEVKTPTSASTITPASMPIAPAPRQRSSTLLPNSISMSSSSPGMRGHGHGLGGTGMVAMPTRPFAAVRRESPASSTGDSSSGRAPFTPRDGSELGVGSGSGSGVTGGTGTTGTSVSGGSRGWSGGVSGLAVGGKHIKRRSVIFEDDLRDVNGGAGAGAGAGAGRGRGGKEEETPGEGEERRKERRRSEAKAAIELGNVINGRGPVVEDDDDDDLPINQTLGGGARMSTLNPMMAMNPPVAFGPGVSPGWNGMNMNMNMPMNPNMNMNMMSPGMLAPGQYMPQGATDPNFMVAHQQAMMFAKQAYQMAVAQQAMAAAGDEWERGSTIGGYGGGGSVYGGTSPSIVGSPYGMSPMMNMGMGMGMGMQSPGNGWSTGSAIFPGQARSMYGGGGISGSRSEYGGGGGRGGGQWSSSKSSYGESFGPSNRHTKAERHRDSGYFPPVPPIPQEAGASSGRGPAPRSRTTSQPATPSRGVRRAPPPSSWKAGM